MTVEITVYGSTFEVTGDYHFACAGTEFAPPTPASLEVYSIQIAGQELIELLRPDIVELIEQEANYNL